MEIWGHLITLSVVCAAFSLALYGWGRLGEHLLRIRWPWPMTICMGLVMVIFLGGMINFLEIAYAATLNAIMVFGLLFGAVSVFIAARQRLVSGPKVTWIGVRHVVLQAGPGAIIILAGFIFVSTYLTPPAAFNVYDDFETYLHLPLRMLATGTLKPGIFSNFGVNSLGAQAFLHGFVAANWSVGYVDAVDALWGFVLTGTLILVIGRRANVPGWLIALAVALVVFINPQYVNVSTSYIGSALLIFLLFLHTGLRNNTASLNPESARFAGITGMVYAALVALKLTFALVVLIHFILTVIAIFAITRQARPVLVWVFCAVVSGSCFLLPWVLNQAYKLLPAVFASSASGPDLAIETYAETRVNELDLFSSEVFIYGFGTGYIHYTALVGLVLACCAVVIFLGYRNRTLRDHRTILAITGCLILPIFYLLQMSMIGQWVMGYDTALRYTVPVLIGIAPAAVLLAASPRSAQLSAGVSTEMLRPATILVGVISVALLWGFSGSLESRMRQAMEYRTALSFLPFNETGKKKGYLRYNEGAFKSYSKNRFAKIQRLVPVNETILSYVSLSIHFDFARNQIWNVDGGGLGSPLLDFPFAGSVDDAARYFSRQGVHYIVWEYRGYAVPTSGDLRNLANSAYPADRRSARVRLAFDRLLKSLSKRSEVLHDDGAIVLFRID